LILLRALCAQPCLHKNKNQLIVFWKAQNGGRLLLVQSCSKVWEHLPKIWIFTTSLENCLICIITLPFTLEEHCYITDVSITTFRSELCNNLVVLEARMFKTITSFAAENMGNKGGYQVWTGQQLLYCMKRGTQKGNYLRNWSSPRLQSIRHSQDPRRLVVFRTWAGLGGPWLPVKKMITL